MEALEFLKESKRMCRSFVGSCVGCPWEKVGCLINAYMSELIKDWSDLCATIGECGGIDRVKELAEADKDSRLVVLPCQSGEHVFALLDGQEHVRECEVKHAVLDGWRKVFYIVPIGDPGNSYGAPFGAFGQTVFLTREEAEKALEAMKDD